MTLLPRHGRWTLAPALLALVVMASAAFASTGPRAASTKIDPHVRIALAHLRGLSASPAAARAVGAAVNAEGDLDVFIRGNVSRGELEAMGVKVRSEVPGLMTAYVPADVLDRVASLPNVTTIRGAAQCVPYLNVSIPAIGVDQVRGAGPSFTGVNGAGVLVGDVDTGVDLAHGDFRDASGNTRLVSVWDQTVATGPPPSGFSLGTEWSQAQINANLSTQKDTDGHGSHCLGIAGGDGSQTGNAIPAFTYAGVAPKADLLMVKTTFSTTDVFDGCNYFFQKAAALGENASLNLSLGLEYGPHDGTSDFESGLTSLTGPGRIISVAAGNDRGTNWHAGFSVPVGGDSAKFTVSSTTNLPLGNPTAAIDGYYNDPDNYDVYLRSPVNTAPIVGPIHLGAVNAAYPGTLLTGSANVYIENGAFLTSTNAREVYIEVTRTSSTHPVSGVWTIYFVPTAAPTSGRVDMWKFYSGAGSTTFTLKNTNDHLVSEPANAFGVISVAAFATKNAWTDCGGRSVHYSGSVPLNDIASFSGLGPTRDGRIKPDIAAPGFGVGSAKSADNSAVCGTGASALLNDNSNHVINQGTSMAAPHVAGAAALLLQKYGALTPAQVLSYLQSHAVVDGFTGGVPNTSWGNGKLFVGDLTNPVVTVTSPNGGEMLSPCTPATLTWSATDNVGVTSVDLQLSRSGPGGPFEDIALGIGNSGSYTWNVTGPATANAYLKVTAHDANNNSGSDLSDAAFAIDLSKVTPVSAALCITPGHPTATIPFNICHDDPTDVRAFHVVFHLSPAVQLAAGVGSITEGTYLSGSHTTNFQVLDNGGGSYTADGAILGLPCGASGASGNLFNVAIKRASAGSYTVTIDSLTLRDCANGDLTAAIGGPATGTVDDAPVAVDPISDPTIAESATLTVNPHVTLTACASGPVTWSATGLPAGASIDPSSGVITWNVPCDAFENGPNYPVTVTASAASGDQGSASFTIHVNNTPGSVTVTVASPPASDELTPITVTPSGSIGPCTTGPLTWSIAPPLPSGASFDPSSGVVNWTPSCGQAGSYGPFTLTATAASGEMGTGSFSLTVNHKTGTVTVSVSDPPATDELSTITVTPLATLTSCAAGGPSWSISPAVPSGASFDPVTGVFNWTPSCGQAGTYGPFTLTATATTGESGTGSFSVTVNHKVGTVAVGPIADPTVAEEATLTVAPTATLTSCAATPLAWTGTYPAGATLNSSSGELNWTPDCHAFENGPDYPVTLTATAATGEFGSVSFTIHVTNTTHVLTAIADLAAQQVKSGNDADGTTKIKITYTAPSGASAVDVYRVGFGHYPLYDDGGGAAPTAPVTPPGPPWVLTGVTASGQTDEVTTRDFYYYVAFARTTCGDVSPVSDLTGGTLNYHLGDVTDGITPGQGDNLVQIEDISLLGSHYGASGATLVGYEYLDVGPTTDRSVDARPTTDARVNFDDLMMFAINYHVVSGPTGMKPVATNTQDVVSLQVTSPSPDRLVAHVILNGSGACQAIATLLAWNPDVLEPIGSGLGSLGEDQHGVAMSAAPGDVDVAMLGLRGQGFTGLGELATVTFHIKGEGAYGLAIKATQGRTPGNQDAPVLINSTTAVNVVAPSATAFAAPSPNPFGVSTALSFSLAKPGAVGLEIYSVDGRRVRTLVRGAREAGEYREVWDGRDEAGAQVGVGIYYARLITPQGEFRRKLVHVQ